MLDLGFTIWYRQKQTPRRHDPDLYLGKVEGSLLKGFAAPWWYTLFTR
jgi:hypothetical protein